MNNTKLVLTIGFSIILGLMIMLASISLLAYQSNIAQIETIVYTNNLKAHYITQMRTHARERTLSLQKMLMYTDAFDRDEEWLRFKDHAGKFIGFRVELLKMGLSAREKKYIRNLSTVIKGVALIQHKISKLILANKDGQARALLIEQAIPEQDKVFEYMSLILAAIEEDTKQAVKRSENKFQATVFNVFLIAGIAIFISILIAKFLIRRITATEQQLFNEKERAQITLYSIGDGAITTDAKGNIEHMNDMAVSITGCSAKEGIGKSLFEVFHLAHKTEDNFMNRVWGNAINNGDVVVSDTDSWLLNRDGNEIAIEYTLAPIFNTDKNVLGTIMIFRDVSELRSLSIQLAYQAQHDELTGLLNRREFETRLSEALAEVRRYPDIRYWLAYIDLDQFKVVNDTCGHLAGDELLKQVSTMIRSMVREVDHFARLGGDEFALIFKDCDFELISTIVERIRRCIHEFRFSWENKCFTISASIGVVEISNNAGSMYDLLSKVDAACYLAKDEGRNRVHFVAQHDMAVIKQRGEMDWVHRIRHALDQERFVLYYQTIKPLQDDNVEFHAEILVRLLDDDGNLIPPNAFIPAAERYNLMTELDRWVVSHTFEFIKANEFQSQVISINLSAQSLCDKDFTTFVITSLDKNNINPAWVCFEITETAAIANLTLAKTFIFALREIGCKFSLDDFGSGLSSFGYLKNLTVDYLKIDGAFVKNIIDDKIDLAMVNAIIQVGHTMGLQTIAEYVENEEIELVLKTMGIDYAQGFGIAKPAPINELLCESHLSGTQ